MSLQGGNQGALPPGPPLLRRAFSPAGGQFVNVSQIATQLADFHLLVEGRVEGRTVLQQVAGSKLQVYVAVYMFLKLHAATGSIA